ncbi:MAG: peptide chain release factor-like protein [Melioribacteraceae bacterium]
MKELLSSITKKDFKIDFFSGTGAGGQHRNKHQNCVRLTHIDSGVMSTGQSSRDRIANQREVFESLVNNPKFKLWHNQKCIELMTGKTIEQKVDESMVEENLKFECRDAESGIWINF